MSRIRLGLTLLAGAALALGMLGPASARMQAGPKYGGTLVVGTAGGEADTLDPTLSRNNVSVEIYTAMCEPLYTSNARLELVPVLATALPVRSKDKLSYTIQLRKGIEFNDGTPFNANAVVTSILRHMTYPGSSRASDFAAIDSVTAPGPYTVAFHLKARDSTFIGRSTYILSPTQLAKVGANFGASPVCVGPFMFDHRVVGDHITLVKSPYYYGRNDVYLDKIVYKPMSDAPAATAALKAGDIQALDDVQSTEVQGVRQMSSLRMIQAYQLGWRGIRFNIGNRNGLGNLPYASNLGTPLSSSAKLRQGFEEAIDRTTMNRVVFGGLVQVSCTVIPPANTVWFEALKVPCTPYDPMHARKLVAASGFPNPTVRLLTSTSTEEVRLAQFIQAQEAAVGINVVIESSTASGARRVTGDFDAYASGFTPGGVDPGGMVNFETSNVRNYGGYSNPRLDLILSNGLKATDTTARSTLYHVAQQIIHDDRPIIVLYNPVTVAAFTTNVTGVALTYNGALNVANARYK